MGPILGFAFPGRKSIGLAAVTGQGRGERLLHGGHRLPEPDSVAPIDPRPLPFL
jgi:hypothetical protein